MPWDEIEESAEDLFELADEVQEDEDNILKNLSDEEEEEVEDDKPAKTKKSSKKEEENSEEDLFKVAEEEDEEEEEEDEEEDNKKPKTSKSSENFKTLELLKEKGLIADDVEIEEGKEREILESTLENLDESIEDAAIKKLEELPEDFKAAITFALKGGSLKDYIEAVNSTYGGAGEFLSENMNLENEETQEEIARIMLAEDFDTEDEIDAQIEFLKDKGSLKKYATKHYNNWLAEKKQAEKDLINKAEARKITEIKEIKEKKENIKNILKENLVLKPSKTDLEDLPSYMFDKKIKLENGASITEFQKDLLITMQKNTKTWTQLAIIAKNLNEDGSINFEALDLKTETDVTQKIKDKIRRNSSNNTSTKRKARSLVDVFSPK